MEHKTLRAILAPTIIFSILLSNCCQLKNPVSLNYYINNKDNLVLWENGAMNQPVIKNPRVSDQRAHVDKYFYETVHGGGGTHSFGKTDCFQSQ